MACQVLREGGLGKNVRSQGLPDGLVAEVKFICVIISKQNMSSKTTHYGTLQGLRWPCFVREEFRHNHVSTHTLTHTHTANEEIQASGSQRGLPKRWTHTKWKESLEPSFLTTFKLLIWSPLIHSFKIQSQSSKRPPRTRKSQEGSS